jgi:hypothetical protein
MIERDISRSQSCQSIRYVLACGSARRFGVLSFNRHVDHLVLALRIIQTFRPLR